MKPLKPRAPGTYADAVTTIMGALTADGAGAAVGKTAALVRKWADPDHPCVPDIEQVEALDAAYRAETGAPGPIGAVLAQRLAARRAGAAHVAKDPHVRLVDIFAEVGELAADLTRARADGVLSVRERAQLSKDARDARKALDALLRDLAGLGGAPAGKRGRR